MDYVTTKLVSSNKCLQFTVKRVKIIFRTLCFHVVMARAHTIDLWMQFAVSIEARANTSLDKMELINAVAKIVPKPHSVDLKNPDKTILLQIVKV